MQNINEQMNNMSDSEMRALLKDLKETQYWVAIQKYNKARLEFAQSLLFTTDPFKDPTSIAKQQGLLVGMSDLTNVVLELNKEVKEEDDFVN